MIRRILGDDPLLLSVVDEYFTGDPYRATEKAERIFLDRQDRYSLMLLKMTKPFNFFPSPKEARRLIEASVLLGVDPSRGALTVAAQSDERALSSEPGVDDLLEDIRVFLGRYEPQDILDEITLYTALNQAYARGLLPPPGEYRNAHDHVKLYHRMLLLMYRIGVGLLEEAAELEKAIKAFERVGVYFDVLPITVYSLATGDDSYLYRARMFYSLLGNRALKALLEGVISFLKGEDFETYGSPVLEQLKDPAKVHYPVLSLPVRFARTMMEGKFFVSFAGDGGIYHNWKRVRIPRYESSFKVLAYFKVGSHFFGDGRRFALENAPILFPKSPNPKKTTYDYLSRLGHLLYAPSDLLHSVRYGTFLSKRYEAWAGRLREVVKFRGTANRPGV